MKPCGKYLQFIWLEYKTCVIYSLRTMCLLNQYAEYALVAATQGKCNFNLYAMNVFIKTCETPSPANGGVLQLCNSVLFCLSAAFKLEVEH